MRAIQQEATLGNQLSTNGRTERLPIVIKPPRVPITRYSIYLPDVPGNANHLFRTGAIQSAVDEYQRLAALGSKGAQSVLAFLSLSGALDDKPDIGCAEAFAKDAADAGDPYAQYVLAWVRYMQGRPGEGLKLLHRSATTAGFVPAILEFARWVEQGIASSGGPDTETAERLYRVAYKKGHPMGLLMLANLYRSGARGAARKVMGYVLRPYAGLLVVYNHFRHPYSASNFLYVPGRRKRFFMMDPLYPNQLLPEASDSVAPSENRV